MVFWASLTLLIASLTSPLQALLSRSMTSPRPFLAGLRFVFLFFSGMLQRLLTVAGL